MKKMLITACAALAFVGCATYDNDRYEGAPATNTDVIYGTEADDPRYHPDTLDYPEVPREPLPPAVPPSGNRLRGVEPAPTNPTEAVPPF